MYAEKKYGVENKEDLLKNILWLIHGRINIEHFLKLLPVILLPVIFPPRTLRNSKSFFEFTLPYLQTALFEENICRTELSRKDLTNLQPPCVSWF